MRAYLRILPVVLWACAASSSGTDVAEQAVTGSHEKANVSLTQSNAKVLQTTDTGWTLTKTGVVNASASTVTWTITATKGATTDALIVVDGDLTAQNIGNGPATIGNIVVNLQTQAPPPTHHHGYGWGWGWGWGWGGDYNHGHDDDGEWVTVSSDVADATSGDDATTAHVVDNASTEHQSSFSENAASGSLSFMDRHTNTVFSLVPEVTIAPHSSELLMFSATFKNAVLDLAPNTKVRAEIILTFGNHPAGGRTVTDTNVDINGNGIIDPDEHKVRSVSTQLEKRVPQPTSANSAIVLTDTAADIATQGTVTFSNLVIHLGTTTGTVTVKYAGGTGGGSITNCVQGTAGGVTDNIATNTVTVVNPVALNACNTLAIGPDICVAGTVGCGWKDGDMTTYGQAEWAADSNAMTILQGNFDAVFASNSGTLQVGTGLSMLFDSANAVIAYLPASGPAAPLDSVLGDPTSSASGVFGGDVTALELNVSFGDAGLLPDHAGVNYGNLSLCGFALPGLNGSTVRQLLASTQSLLGGGTAAFAISDIDPIVQQVNGAFTTGAATSFAQDHLVNGACP